MLLTISEARETLRLDSPDNDIIIEPLLHAISSYLEVKTGRSWDDADAHPLAQTAAKFILQLWYDPDGQDTQQLKRTIDNLLAALEVVGRTHNGT